MLGWRHMPTDLEQAIWRTCCWFSLFDYPLTRFELWRWLDTYEATPLDVCEALDSSVWLRQRLSEYGGFVSCRMDSTQEMVRERHVRFIDALHKYKKVQRVVGLARLLPTIQAVGAVNTLSWWHTQATSDIDLFVVVRPGSIWLSRLLLVLPFWRERPGRATEHPFCFSFFVTSDHLDISNVALEDSDPYLDFWRRAIVPLYDPGGLLSGNPPPQTTTSTLFFLESFARWVQIKHLPAAILQKLGQGTDVVVSDTMLKFHVDDARRRYRTLWHERINEIA